MLDWESPEDELEIKTTAKQYIFRAGTYGQVPLNNLGCELVR